MFLQRSYVNIFLRKMRVTIFNGDEPADKVVLHRVNVAE